MRVVEMWAILEGGEFYRYELLHVLALELVLICSAMFLEILRLDSSKRLLLLFLLQRLVPAAEILAVIFSWHLLQIVQERIQLFILNQEGFVGVQFVRGTFWAFAFLVLVT